MSRTLLSRRLLSTAMALSLSGLAGCAAPVTSTVPTQVADMGVTPPAAPGVQLGEAPIAPAGVAALVVQGQVAFRSEALSGYAVRAFNPLTGAELALTNAVTTDHAGKFQASVASLQAGQLVRLVAAKDHVVLEGTFRVGAEGGDLSISEATTVHSLIAGGPLKVAGLMTGEQAGSVVDAYLASLTTMEAPLAAALASQPNMANQVIRAVATDKEQAALEGTLESLVNNANQGEPLVNATLALVQAVAKAPHANQFATFSVKADAPVSFVRFLGTHFRAGVGGATPSGLQVMHVRTGRLVDAGSANAGDFAQIAKPLPKKHKHVFTGPFTPQFLSRYESVEDGVPVFLYAAIQPARDSLDLPFDLPIDAPVSAWISFFTTGQEGGRRFVDLNVVKRRALDEVMDYQQTHNPTMFEDMLGIRDDSLEPTFEVAQVSSVPDFMGDLKPLVGKLPQKKLGKWTRPVLRYYIDGRGEITGVGRFKPNRPEVEIYSVAQVPSYGEDWLIEESKAEEVGLEGLGGLSPFGGIDFYAFRTHLAEEKRGGFDVTSGFVLDKHGFVVAINGIDQILQAFVPDEVLYAEDFPVQLNPTELGLQRQIKIMIREKLPLGGALRADWLYGILSMVMGGGYFPDGFFPGDNSDR